MNLVEAAAEARHVDRVVSLVKAADAARYAERIETIRVAVLAAKKVAYQMKGDSAGHEFHGNRYTGGVGGGHAFIAEHFGGWHEAMSPAQQKALAFYQSPGYRLMNGLLRGENPNAPAKDLSRARAAITNLTAAIADAPPLTHDAVAFRGMSKAQFDFADGAMNHEPGFTSVALDRNAASLSGSGEQVMAEIRIPAGARVGAGYSRELILPANSALRVVSGGSHPVLEYVPTSAKGDSSGHAFHGNRWTGGIGGGGGEAAAHPKLGVATIPPTGLKLAGKVRESVSAYDKIAMLNLGKWDSTANGSGPKVKDGVVKELVRESTGAQWNKETGTWEPTKPGLSYDRANAIIATWARSSSDTTPDSIAMQMAISERFGVNAGTYLEERAQYMAGGYRNAIETGPPAPRPDVDDFGRLLMGQDSIEGHAFPGDKEWNDKYMALASSLAVSVQLDPKTSFVVPKGYTTETTVNHGYGDYVARPFPGYGTHVFTEHEGWMREKLANGDERFTRDNTLKSAASGGTDFGKPADFADRPVSWDQRVADAKVATDAIYAHTQRELDAAGIRSMTVFRGMNWYGENKIPEALAKPDPESTFGGRLVTKSGDYDVKMHLNPLSSFSVNSNSAAQFGAGDRGLVVGVTVPADRIFSIASTGPGCLNEGEVIVIGGPTDMHGGPGYLEAVAQDTTLKQSNFYSGTG